jgi:hypothetical protein
MAPPAMMSWVSQGAGMAFSLPDLWLVQELKRQGYLPARGAIVEIGAQQIDRSILTSEGDLEELARAFGVATPPPTLVSGLATPGNSLAGAPRARLLWEWLGLEYAAIDIDGSPGSVAIDLNFDEVPDSARGRYSIVTNYGTTEHLANQLNAFKAIHDLTKVDGTMIHHLPYHCPEHGFFGYNSKFFWALARSNEYLTVYHRLNSPEAPESVHVVLQKRHELPFVAPLDVDDASTTDNASLRERYWTIFDRAAIMKIAESKEAQLRRREADIYGVEQRLAAREEAAQAREQAVYLREQTAAAWERAHPPEIQETQPIPRPELRVAVAKNLTWLRAIKRRMATSREH